MLPIPGVMVELTDIWYLHRERCLQAIALVLYVAAVAIVLSHRTGDESSYEFGSLLGVATRNVFVGIVGGALVKYLIDRFYWYDEDASWRNISPEVLAAGGVVAIALSIIFGGPGPAAASANQALAGDCSESQRNPQEMLSSLGYSELSADQARQVNPNLANATPEIAALTHSYVNGSPSDPVLVTIVGTSEEVAGSPFDEFTAASQQAGLQVRDVSLGGHPVKEASSSQEGQRSLIGVTGCYTIGVAGRGNEANSAMRQVLLAGAPG